MLQKKFAGQLYESPLHERASNVHVLQGCDGNHGHASCRLLAVVGVQEAVIDVVELIHRQGLERLVIPIDVLALTSLP